MKHSRAALVLALVTGLASFSGIAYAGNCISFSGSPYNCVVLVDPGTGLPYAASGSGSGGDASATNQLLPLQNPGSDATKATSVQGITGGKPVPVSASSLPLPAGAALEAGNLATLVTNTTGLSTLANQNTGNTYLSQIQAATPYKTVIGQVNATPPIAAAGCSSGQGCNLLDSTNSGQWTDIRGLGTPEIILGTSSTLTAGALTIETAIDNTGSGVQSINCMANGVTLGASALFTFTPAVSGLYKLSCPLHFGYVRVRASTGFTVSSGTAISAYLYSSSANNLYQNVVQSGTWTMQPGNTANTTPWPVTPSAGITGGYSFANLTTNAANTVIKSSSGTIHSVTINTRGTATTLTCGNHATTAATNPLFSMDTTLSTTAFLYDIALTNGLTCTTAGTTPADLTITYK